MEGIENHLWKGLRTVLKPLNFFMFLPVDKFGERIPLS